MPARDVRDGAPVAVQSAHAPSKLGGILIKMDHAHPRVSAHESNVEPQVDENNSMKSVVVDEMIPRVEKFKTR